MTLCLNMSLDFFLHIGGIAQPPPAIISHVLTFKRNPEVLLITDVGFLRIASSVWACLPERAARSVCWQQTCAAGGGGARWRWRWRRWGEQPSDSGHSEAALNSHKWRAEVWARARSFSGSQRGNTEGSGLLSRRECDALWLYLPFQRGPRPDFSQILVL